MAPSRTDKTGSDVRMRIRQRSKRLFGNADRLEVALAVAESSGLVHAQELADRLSISPPRVRAQLLAFVEAGIMRALPRTSLIQNYERIDDPFWSLVSELVLSWR
jgi:DNA-binding transcriptional ArsR family regulator